MFIAQSVFEMNNAGVFVQHELIPVLGFALPAVLLPLAAGRLAVHSSDGHNCVTVTLRQLHVGYIYFGSPKGTS